MNKQQLDTIINDYLYESDFFDNIEEYLNFKQVPQEQIKTASFRIKALINKTNRLDKTAELTKIFNSCIAFKALNTAHNERYIIYHPCTKSNSNKYQISFFDQYGAIMDIARDTLIELIKEYYTYSNSYNISEVIAC